MSSLLGQYQKMKPRQEYSTIAVLAFCLVAVTFVASQHPQIPTPSQLAVAKVRYLNHVASIHLLPGMTSPEVDNCLAIHGLHPISLAHGGVSMTIFYGREGLFDPVIAVDFRRERKRGHLVTEWRVER